MNPAPVIRWPGAKWRIAEWICGHLPGWQTVRTSARTQTNAQRPETLWINPVGWKRLSHAPALLIERP